MRRLRQLVLGVSVSILVSLAAALPASATPAPTGPQLPFTLAGSGSTFDFPANAPFHVSHSLLGTATTRQGLAQARDDSLTYFQLGVTGGPPTVTQGVQPATPIFSYTSTSNSGPYSWTHGDLINFKAGLPPGTYTLTFSWYSDGTLQNQETETYVFSLAGLVITPDTYGCASGSLTCWGTNSAWGLAPNAQVQIHAATPFSGVVFLGSADSNGSRNVQLGLVCGANWTGVYATSTDAQGNPITSNVVDTPCG